jgi:hypothetical protein
MASLKARVELDRSRVLAVGVSLAAPYVAETTRQALNRTRVTAPKRTSRMANSLKMTMRPFRTYVRGRVTASPRYTHYVERGTAPHRIVARKKKALKFRVAGGVVIVRSVRHPGTKPRPFMFRALVETAIPRGFIVRRTTIARGVAV